MDLITNTASELQVLVSSSAAALLLQLQAVGPQAPLLISPRAQGLAFLLCCLDLQTHRLAQGRKTSPKY